MEEKDELDELFVDESETIDKQTLRDILEGRVQLTRAGEIHFLPACDKLGAKPKILLYLLGKKALSVKLDSTELSSPKEIHENTGLPEGTVYPYLRDLEKLHLVSSQDGEYFVPNYAIPKIKEEYFGD